jgi:hypothetical protein
VDYLSTRTRWYMYVTPAYIGQAQSIVMLFADAVTTVSL